MKEKSDQLYFMFWESGEVFFSFSEKTQAGGMDGTGHFPKQVTYHSTNNWDGRGALRLPSL